MTGRRTRVKSDTWLDQGACLGSIVRECGFNRPSEALALLSLGANKGVLDHECRVGANAFTRKGVLQLRVLERVTDEARLDAIAVAIAELGAVTEVADPSAVASEHATAASETTACRRALGGLAEHATPRALSDGPIQLDAQSRALRCRRNACVEIGPGVGRPGFRARIAAQTEVAIGVRLGHTHPVCRIAGAGRTLRVARAQGPAKRGRACAPALDWRAGDARATVTFRIGAPERAALEAERAGKIRGHSRAEVDPHADRTCELRTSIGRAIAARDASALGCAASEECVALGVETEAALRAVAILLAARAERRARTAVTRSPGICRLRTFARSPSRRLAGAGLSAPAATRTVADPTIAWIARTAGRRLRAGVTRARKLRRTA